ncbi:hypothetical protein C4J81_06800 [Deltaproteobacteria bacterium Smac51]|nr:hypothetical protein C4J81_06800 [Deltaproteobacteria bacterium Smac51]
MKQNYKDIIERYYHTWFSISELYALWAKRHGLTVNSLLALYVIQNTKNCTQHDICSQLMLSKQTVNSILNNFDQLGYVIKIVGNSDKRSKSIKFTSEGQRYADKVLSELFEAESAAFQAMSPEHITGLIEGNQRFLDNFRNTLK